MASNTEKGNEVRKYYEKIEKLLHKYKDHIIENLSKRIDILENNQKPKISTSKGVIYFLKSQLETDDIFKLGKSKKFKKRLLSHNSSHSDDVEIALVFETEYIDEIEGCIKLILKKYQYRKRKEIYQVNLNILKEIMEGCEELIMRTNIKSLKKKTKELSRTLHPEGIQGWRPTDTSTKNNVDYNYFLYFDKHNNINSSIN